MTKTAQITGITDQDRIHLARLLLDKGYRVVVAFLCARMVNMARLDALGEVKKP